MTKEERYEILVNDMMDYYSAWEEDFAEDLQALNSMCSVIAPDDEWFPMSEFEEFYFSCPKLEVIDRLDRDFNANDEYFHDGVYGIESSDTPDYSDYNVRHIMNDIVDYAGRIKFCSDIMDMIDEYDNFEEDEVEEEEEINEG